MTKRFWKTDRSIYHWKRQWNRKKQQDIPPLKVPKFYTKFGYEIIDADNPENFESNDIKVYDMANPYVPPPLKWIDLFKDTPIIPDKLSYLYKLDTQLIEGIQQAQLLTNSVIFEDAIAPNIQNLFATNKDRKTDLYEPLFDTELDNAIKNIIYQSKKWNTHFENIEPIIKDRFRLKYPKIKSIPWDITSKVFGKNLIGLFESFGGQRDSLNHIALSNQPLNSFISDVKVVDKKAYNPESKDFSLINLQIQGETSYIMYGNHALQPFMDVESVGNVSANQALPDIFPILPHLGLAKNFVYDYNTQIYIDLSSNIDISTQSIYPHFIFDINVTKDWNIGQYIAKGMLFAYGHLATLAQTLYGPNVEGNLKRPLCLNYVGCNGQRLAYVSFQLNSLPQKVGADLSDPPLKNVAWVHTDDPSTLLYRHYDLETSEIQEYNPKCLENLFNFYLHGLNS